MDTAQFSWKETIFNYKYDKLSQKRYMAKTYHPAQGVLSQFIKATISYNISQLSQQF